MNFDNIPKIIVDDKEYLFNPFAGKIEGEWIEGYTSLEFLNANFKNFTKVDDCKNATNSEGLKLYFDYLKDNKWI